MSTHVALAPEEREAVLRFWRDFVLRGGEGDPPSAFQFDALNDEAVRDAFLFWHIGGNPFAEPGNAWEDAPLMSDAMGVLGPVPTDYTATIKAMTKAVDELNASEPDVYSVDTATVLIVAHVMLGMLLKKFDEMSTMLTQIIHVNLRLAEKTGDPILHTGPLEAMATALQIISKEETHGSPEKASEMLKDVFAVKELPVLVDSRKEGSQK